MTDTSGTTNAELVRRADNTGGAGHHVRGVDLWTRIAELERRLATAESQLAANHADNAPSPTPLDVPASGATPSSDALDQSSRTDRRALLRGAGLSAVGAVGGAVFAQAAPAAADNGDPINAGEDTTSTASTSLTSDIPVAPGIAGLKVVDRSLASLPGTAAIAGHSNGRFDNSIFGYHEGVVMASAAGRTAAPRPA